MQRAHKPAERQTLQITIQFEIFTFENRNMKIIFLKTMVLPTINQSSMKNATGAKKLTLRTLFFNVIFVMKLKQNLNLN